MNKIFRSLAFYALMLLISLSLVNWLSEQGVKKDTKAYSEFFQMAREGRFEEVKIVGENLEGTYKDGKQEVKIKSEGPGRDIQESLIPVLREKKITHSYTSGSSSGIWATLLTTLLPVILVVGAFFFIMQQSQGSGNRVMQFGRSRARLHTDDRKRVTFDDVIGIDEVKEEMTEVVDFLKHPKKYLEMGARIPKGVLLFGPPGTGKTWLARAVAGEAGVPFFSISGSDFVEMFVGVGASRVRDLFEQAKKNSPCIVFIDEIDAVGRMRGAGYGGGHDEREQTLNQLLVEMDGFGVNEGIIVMAATNRPDVLDPALLRPGRFDRQIVIDKPDVNGRRELFQLYGKGKPLGPEVNLEVMAKRTPGFTPADIANLMNEAALLSARKRKRKVGQEELEAAVDRIVAGGPEKKSRIISEKEKRTVAYHEASHALVGKLLVHTDPVHKISIIPRGGALGYVLQLPLEDRYLVTKAEILDRVTMALAGRAAEEQIFGEISTGAHDDIEKASKMVRRMITEFGMSEALGPLTFGNKQDQVFLGRDFARERNYSEEIAAAIDREVQHIVVACYEKALDLLKKNRRKLDKIAETLLEKETLDGPELEELLNSVEERAS